jgi:hypothetical protein
MKKKETRREHRIKKCTRITAQFYNRFGHLPHGLINGLESVDISDLVLSQCEISRWSMAALFSILHGGCEDGYDASGPDNNHPGLIRNDGTMYQ